MSTTFDEIVQERKAQPKHIADAKKIAIEIKNAWAFPESNPELSKHGQMGYKSDVGSPHQWWYSNCETYRELSDSSCKGRDLHTCCLLAQALLEPHQRFR